MANIFYEPGRQRAAKVRDLFARIAPRYDLLNDLQSFGLHRYWKRRLVQLAGARSGLLALDVCCGTGDIALSLARQGAAVTGLDFSKEMLAVARAKSEIRNPTRCDGATARRESEGNPKPEIRSRDEVASTNPPTHQSINPSIQSSTHPPIPSFPTLRFVHGDAQQLPFPDSSFDIVTIGYGLRNLADMEIGLREMQRVAKPGGRLLVLDFGKPDNPLWLSLYFGYLRLFVPVLGLIFCGSASAYAYILESLKHYPAQQGVAAKMRDLGLANVRIISFLGGVMSINYAEKPETG
jgi:demethylmenaquinone methyltransferase / 2-methoxy-6-polyprenyl-1,4-benzoquinol methylase